MRSRRLLRCGVLAGAAIVTCALGTEREAQAQLQFGQIQGSVTLQVGGRDTGRAMAGVTIVVSGPALQGEQTEITDASGRYIITQLPPGDNYVVRFYFNDVVVERPGIRVTQGKTLSVSAAVPTQRGKERAIVIRERAPNVDVANANVGVEINQEVLQNTAVRGRTYESVISLSPGSVDPPRNQAGGDVGVSISGSSGNENTFLIDGLNTTDPAAGLLGTQLNQYFIKEVNVITGGYQAEFGRATGGVVSIATKTGSNEFHGSVFASIQPLQLEPRTVARYGEALGTRRRTSMLYDFGFELGGPVVKDRVWFYVGFAPTFTNTRVDRVLRRRVQNPASPGMPLTDPDYQCPGYLSDTADPGGRDVFCSGARQVAYLTEERSSTELSEYRRLYNGIAKLQINLSPDHNITLGYLGSPEVSGGFASVTGNLDANRVDDVLQIHDATARYIGKFFDRRLQLDVLYGFHYQGRERVPQERGKQSISYFAPGKSPLSLADFEDLPDCVRTKNGAPTAGDGVDDVAAGVFNPCPLTTYTTGGFGQYVQKQVLQRHVVQASATAFLRLLGTHAIKLGFDFEDNQNDNRRVYSGTDGARNSYRTNPEGTQIRWQRAYAQSAAVNAYGEAGKPCGPVLSNGAPIYCYDYFRGITETRNFSLFLRDSWNVSIIPGLVINAGVRWEAQEIYGQRVGTLTNTGNGLDPNKPQVAIYDNIAPRVGLAYDFSRKGRSKLFFNYGRFYESIPMTINDRMFSGEGLVIGTAGSFRSCPTQTLSGLPGARGLPTVCDGLPPGRISGGSYGLVAPVLRGQYINEIVTGVQYDVGWDVVVGAAYTYRSIGAVVEDLSVDGGATYFLANPGATPDPAKLAQLDQEAQRLRQAAASDPMNAQLRSDASLAQQQYDVYRAVAQFPNAKRDYHALTLTVNKRLSNRFSILANYTYARLLGNYPGTFSSNNNQLDPNISSQFDVIDLLVNRNGPLSNDRPHNAKLLGIYSQPVGKSGTISASLTFTAYSGRPIEVLGQHPEGRAREVFILPRGSGGRTPTVTQFDLHVGYEHQLSKLLRLQVYADVVNLFNQREITNVDDEYTQSPVLPILNGRTEDLARLRVGTDGNPIVYNSNYGQPTAFQEPLFLRFGGRLSF